MDVSWARKIQTEKELRKKKGNKKYERKEWRKEKWIT